MTKDARELLEAVREELRPGESKNRLVPMIERGEAARSVFGTIAAEETHIVRSDWRSLHQLATRADELLAREFFGGLAQGEGVALTKLPALAAAGGMDEGDLKAYEPMAGCQAYPAYFAWLALGGEAADVIVGVVANFGAWGDYCARIAAAAREKYGLDDEAVAFFDFFATPVPGQEEQAIAAIQAGMDAGRSTERLAFRYGRLFQAYELMFWNTIADCQDQED
ncbi:transcriptional regulator [Actinophytocola sp.]|uniref:transcriptional regulator n=1 Tax=Actinophytocola sp. TaxID=1872138 RepID=UPI003D6C0AE4